MGVNLTKGKAEIFEKALRRTIDTIEKKKG